MDDDALDSPIEISNKEILHELQKRWKKEDSRYHRANYYHFGEFLIVLGAAFFGIGISLASVPNQDSATVNAYLEMGGGIFGFGIVIRAIIPFLFWVIPAIYSAIRTDLLGKGE